MKLKMRPLSILLFLVTLLFTVPSLASPPTDLKAAPLKEDSGKLLKIAKADSSLKEAAPAIEARVKDAYGKLPLYFIKNEGQVDKKVEFFVKGAGYTIYFTTEGVKFSLYKTEKVSAKAWEISGPAANKTIITKSEFFSLSLIDSNKKAKIIGVDKQAGKVNYFIGNDKSKWLSNVPTFASVLYKEVYKGIDLKFYGKGQTLEYDVIIKAGADPENVKFVYEGIKGLQITDSGDMQIGLKDALIVQSKPFTYQDIDGKRVKVESGFSLLKGKKNKHAYSFNVASYNKKYPLVIDPALEYSTYLGGLTDDTGTSIAVDSSDNAYVTGYTTSSGSFPTASPYQGTHAGDAHDVFVTKINAAGSALVYSTYLGGSGNDLGEGIAVDSSGNAYITGWTNSTDFPMSSANDSTLNDGVITGIYDAFVTKISADGSALTYSTYLGGDGGDFGIDIAVTGSTRAHITGYTGSTNFPNVSSVQASHGGGAYDAFVTKFSPSGATIELSTYLGGTGVDYGHGIAVDSIGDIYITGQTLSSDDSYPTLIAFQSSYGGGSADAFVTKITSGGFWGYSTYLGGNGYELGFSIAVDSFRNAYVTGETYSTNFPTNSPIYPSNSGGSDIFVTKFTTGGGSTMYSTYLGGSGDDFRSYIAVDSSRNAYITGETRSGDFPTVSAIDSSLGGTRDAFVTKINTAGSAVLFSTYLGGSNVDVAHDIALDSSANIYLTGYTNSTDFPTASPYQGTNGGNYDTFITKINMNSPELTYSAEAGYGGADGVDPETGTTSTSFTYKVIYTSPSDLPPTFVYTMTDLSSDVMIVDTGAAASLHDGDYTNGEQYISTTTLASIGTRTYYFTASDGSISTSLPASGTISNPYIIDLAITTASLADGDVSVAYSQTLAATGGTSPYTWGLASGTLPAGLNLNTSTGEISGTPTTNGVTAFTVQVTDDNSYVLTKALSITINMPDYVVVTATAPASVEINGSFSFEVSIKNDGTGDAFSQTIWRLYLSTDTNITAADTSLDVDLTMNALSVGASSGDTRTLTIPGDTTPGTYYIGVIADATDTVAESNESNNTGYDTVSVVYPVLNILTSSLSDGSQSLSYTRTATATGGDGSYSWSIISGTLPDGLSLNASTGVISGTPSATGTTNFTLQVADTSANTDTQALSITINLVTVDLTVSALTASATATAGMNIAISSTIENLGIEDAGTFFTFYFISSDTTLSAGDRYIGYLPSWFGLASGATTSATFNLKWPLDISSGTHYILASTDYTDYIAESNETNNTTASNAITVTSGVDIIVNSVSASASVNAGGQVSIDSVLENLGSADSADFMIKYYLSTDTALDADDIYIGYRPVWGGIAAGGTDTDTGRTLTIPADTIAGTYYIVVDADAEDTNDESDEGNNTGVSGAVTVTAGIDLIVNSLLIPASATAGGTLAVDSVIENQGDAIALGFIVEFYLSTDTALSADDIFLGYRPIWGGLIAASTDTATTNFEIPVNTVAGNYYVIADVDTENTNNESDEANNTGVSGAVTITVGVDLVVNSISVPASASSGGSLAIDNTVGNPGTVGSTSFIIKFYLSTDTALDAGDTYLGYRPVWSGVSAGGTNNATTTLSIPAGTTTGVYYVVMDVDADDTNTESDEGNNTGASSGTVTISPGVDLLTTSVTAPATGIVGAAVSISSTIENQGTVGSTDFLVKYYLSVDTTLSADDVYIGYRPVWNGVSAGGSNSDTREFTIPIAMAGGNYFVVVDADAENTNTESNETNNTGASGVITVSP